MNCLAMLMPVLASEVRTKLLALVNVGLAPTNSVFGKFAPPARFIFTVNTTFSSVTFVPLAATTLAVPAARPGQLYDKYLWRH